MTTKQPFKLTQDLRMELVREGHKARRAGDDLLGISDVLFSHMLGDEVRFGTGDYEAVEISDYAYGVANFVTRGREW